MIELNLEKDLCFFDLESTGLNVIRDRIIQIAIVKLRKDGKPHEELTLLINPGIPISQEAMDVHGITPDMLRNKPIFAQVARQIYDFIGDSDIAGYNSNRFDIPLLMEEFARVGFEFELDKRKTIDVQRIFYKMEPRTLSAALMFYCGKKMTNAHDALADVKATIDVFKGQISMYENTDFEDGKGNIFEKPIRNDMKAIHTFTNDTKVIDVTQRLKYNTQDEIVFNFGKYNGKKVADVFKIEPNYYHWIMSKEFSFQVKRTVAKIWKEIQQ